jgi:calcium binding protein 39
VEKKYRKVMVLYVNRKENLMIIMKLLKHKSTNIQYEAFHVFKIFIANPDKDDRVKHVLQSNVNKLIKFMKSFLNDKCNDDHDLYEERNTVIESLIDLSNETDE